MKLVKSLLLGSAAGLCAVSGAQAADLPMRKAAPVEYVRVCTVHGAGFFFIPGTDTCIRIGGRARFEYQYTSQRTRNADVSGFRGLGRLAVDARTSTPYGTLRTFIRIDIASRTGGYLTSGTQQRYANAFFGSGQDTFGRAQKFVDVDRAFVQFAGIVAGRSQSVYDFYAGDIELIGAGVYSSTVTNLLSYTGTFGGGFSATIAMEDPIYRRNPTFAAGLAGQNVVAGTGGGQTGGQIILGNAAFTNVGNNFAPGGIAVSTVTLDVAQRNHLPDFVAALRLDQAWGSAQLSGAVHELRTGNYLAGTNGANGLPAVAIGTAGSVVPRVPNAEYGYAVQAGLKLNLPQLAPGDTLWLQAAYSVGANSYAGSPNPIGGESLGAGATNRFGGVNVPGNYDMAVDTFGRTHLTEVFGGSATLLHYWTPEVRQGFFGTYARVHFDKALRSPISPVLGSFNNFANFANPGTAGGLFSGFGKDYNIVYAGSNLIYSPVRDLDIGVEVVYQRYEFLGGASRGRVVDANKAQAVGGVARAVSIDDNILARLRIQRDF